MVLSFPCVFAALLFSSANITRIVYYAQERRREHWDWNAYLELDPTYLQTEWNYRVTKKGLWIASCVLNALGWIAFAYPVIQMAWVLSRQGTQGLKYNFSIMLLALGGAMAEWLANLFWIGMTMATEKLVREFNLDEWVRDDVAGANDGMGWRTMEINHVGGSGVVWFVDAFEWLCLAGLFLCTFMAVRLERKQDATIFGARWNSLSLFIGLLSILEFVAEILRFEGFQTFGPIALVYAVLNRLILMPAWLISLAFLLPRAELKHIYTNTNPIAAELALAELSSAVDGAVEPSSPTSPDPITSHFSIDTEEEDTHPMESNTTTPANGPPPEAFAKSPSTLTSAST